MYGQVNKLFLLGNGFDLAHGLKTRYNDFIDNLWDSEKTKILTSKDYSYSNSNGLYTYNDEILQIRSPRTISELVSNYNISQDVNGYKWFMNLVSNPRIINTTFVGSSSSKVSISIKNTFLEKISEWSLYNWVDVESTYYSVLKNCFKIQNENTKSKYTIEMLNNDFLEISKYLELYLSNINNRIGKNDNILLKLRYILQPELTPQKEKLNDKDVILFLNFNYTNTEVEYIDYFKCSIPQNIFSIHIHGELNKNTNPIIFGYGDEFDDEYFEIEKSNDNEYLKNVKSIRYLQTPNYRNLLSFIDAYKYNVYIMGHSCGMSDRTLLNTIFEHKNCASIKLFYHKREDGTDDHNEKIMNIYRNFRDKPSMREKVIDKTNCEPLV